MAELVNARCSYSWHPLYELRSTVAGSNPAPSNKKNKMNKTNKKIKQAKEKLDKFSPRGSVCPICKKSFRQGCSHSVNEAKDRLFQEYIAAITVTNQD